MATDKELDEQFEEWVASRPPVVQEMIKKFHPRTHSKFMIEDTMYFLLGYQENGMLIVSKINPHESEDSYKKAIKAQEFICAEHISDGNRVRVN